MTDDGQQALLIVWDHASWHVRCAVRTRIKAHHQRVKRASGCRLVICQLPSQFPRLNRIEPPWGHGTRTIAAPTRQLTGADTTQRIRTYDHCEFLDPIAHKVA